MSVPKSRKVSIRKENQRAVLQNLLLGKMAELGTYQNAVIADLRPQLNALQDTYHWGPGEPSINALEALADDQRDAAQYGDAPGPDLRLEGYLEHLDRFTARTLGLQHLGRPAAWARDAIHWHVRSSLFTRPVVTSASWQFWRDLTISVRVTDGYARVEAANHIGELVDHEEVDAPAWTSFNDWPQFMEKACALFVRQLERVRSEMLDEYDDHDMNRQRGSLIADMKRTEVLAKLLLARPRQRGILLREHLNDLRQPGDNADPEKALRSEKQRIRNLCALLGLDSPFTRQQKK